MTINQIISGFKSIAKSHPQIRSFKTGNSVTADSVKEYPLMCVRIESSNPQEYLVNHSFRLLILDLPTHDKSDTVNIQSDCFETLNDVLTILEDYPEFEAITITLGSNATPVDVANADGAAGYEILLSVNVNRNRCVNLCND